MPMPTIAAERLHGTRQQKQKLEKQNGQAESSKHVETGLPYFLAANSAEMKQKLFARCWVFCNSLSEVF